MSYDNIVAEFDKKLAEMTQDEVAKALHVGKQTIVNWEKGATEPKISQIRQLSALYKMPIEHIFLPEKSN